MAICMTVSKIGRVQSSEGSRHSEIDYNSLKMQFRIVYTTEIECILNGLPWRWFMILVVIAGHF